MKYGIELEFFVKKRNIVPAIEGTYNVDGNHIIGELRTKVHDSITDCVFELKKLLYLEEKALSKKGYTLLLIPEIKVDDKFLKDFRASRGYSEKKNQLETFSIYGKSTGKILSVKQFKASLQINISNTEEVSFYTYSKEDKKEKYTYKTRNTLFEFPTIIRNLDKIFSSEIKNSKRVPGVYAIKDGEFGKRIEYRSLPNNINLDKLLTL